ncbi:MAG: DUF3667 domain-containing protein [Saprospiraceae bacterium]|nr:DUF3667 domain-containing protein [Saprospiraceae bacterium]
MTTICKNCASSFEGKFCNQCGQAADTPEINFRSVAQELQHTILQIDKGLLYTTRELLLRPGKTIRGYLEGKRVQHIKPFAYIFILSTLYALLTTLTRKSTFLADFLDGFYDGTTESEAQSDMGLVGDIVLWMSSHYAYTTLLIIPLISLASYLCFAKMRYNYFQHLVLNSYVAGQRTAVFLLLLPFTYFITDESTNDFIDTVKVYLGIALTFWTYYQFFNTTRVYKRILLTILTYVVMLVLIFLITLIIALVQKVF